MMGTDTPYEKGAGWHDSMTTAMETTTELRTLVPLQLLDRQLHNMTA
jgi:hypothetical protein